MELDINKYELVDGVGDRALRPSPIMDITADRGEIRGNLTLSKSVLRFGEGRVRS